MPLETVPRLSPGIIHNLKIILHKQDPAQTARETKTTALQEPTIIARAQTAPTTPAEDHQTVAVRTAVAAVVEDHQAVAVRTAVAAVAAEGHPAAAAEEDNYFPF